MLNITHYILLYCPVFSFDYNDKSRPLRRNAMLCLCFLCTIHLCSQSNMCTNANFFFSFLLFSALHHFSDIIMLLRVHKTNSTVYRMYIYLAAQLVGIVQILPRAHFLQLFLALKARIVSNLSYLSDRLTCTKADRANFPLAFSLFQPF